MSNITITRKNQLTIPQSYVQQLHLGDRRIMSITIKNGSLVLTPQPSLADTMRQFWNKHKATQPASDDELRQAARTIAVRRAAE